MKKVYIDGIFDLFHIGHLESFKKAKNIYGEENANDVYLIIGIINDNDATNYKRKPIINEEYRYEIVKNIKYVDEIITSAPLLITEDFINKHNIDMVVHGFYNKDDFTKQEYMFEIPIKLKKFKIINYFYKSSTTEIINTIKEKY